MSDASITASRRCSVADRPDSVASAPDTSSTNRETSSSRLTATHAPPSRRSYPPPPTRPRAHRPTAPPHRLACSAPRACVLARPHAVSQPQTSSIVIRTRSAALNRTPGTNQDRPYPMCRHGRQIGYERAPSVWAHGAACETGVARARPKRCDRTGRRPVDVPASLRCRPLPPGVTANDGVDVPAFSEALAAHLHDHLGLVHDGQLDALGVTPSQRRAMVTDGVLIPMFDQVYRARSNPLTLEAHCLAICMSDPHAVITGRAAGRLWDVRGMGRIDRIEVRLPHFRNRLSDPAVVVRRCNVLQPVDVTRRADGIRVVSPPRLIFDLAASVDDVTLESVVEQVLDRGWCTIPTIFDVGRRLVHRARPGSTRFIARAVVTTRVAQAGRQHARVASPSRPRARRRHRVGSPARAAAAERLVDPCGSRHPVTAVGDPRRSRDVARRTRRRTARQAERPAGPLDRLADRPRHRRRHRSPPPAHGCGARRGMAAPPRSVPSWSSLTRTDHARPYPMRRRSRQGGYGRLRCVPDVRSLGADRVRTDVRGGRRAAFVGRRRGRERATSAPVRVGVRLTPQSRLQVGCAAWVNDSTAFSRSGTG